MQSIRQYSWASACLAHLYRLLCRASRFNCKKIDGPLTLLLTWAWICLPYLALVPRKPRSFPLANRWCNWERGDRRFRYLTLEHFRKALDDLQEGQWTNRYNHILTEFSMPPQHPLDIYIYWYHARYSNHLNLSDRVGQENDEGNQVMDDDNEEQEPQSPPHLPPPPPTQERPQFSNPYVPET
ncbi:hypothetical protein Ahy_A05g023587 [Arachis hypogaea]|uniref:Aminotransferase-like plant mobile domain-containing protein n=1 Tax=Arachis hypogaea TaxID=3818 RepID=A0A445D3Z5_ARAHY|nr:hypothetical protein Ahy_A05g023587 [Arachis hypogaea]